jgi:hypothetical protein
METIDLRACPFCSHDKPELAMIGNDDAQIIVVAGDRGPIAPHSGQPAMIRRDTRPVFMEPAVRRGIEYWPVAARPGAHQHIASCE